jgi:hypothetical protein
LKQLKTSRIEVPQRPGGFQRSADGSGSVVKTIAAVSERDEFGYEITEIRGDRV